MHELEFSHHQKMSLFLKFRSRIRGRLRSLRRRGERVAQAGRLPVREGSSPSWRHAMWTTESRALVGDFGAGQALSDEQYALLAPLIPPAKPGGRPRTTERLRPARGPAGLLPARADPGHRAPARGQHRLRPPPPALGSGEDARLARQGAPPPPGGRGAAPGLPGPGQAGRDPPPPAPPPPPPP